MLRVLSAYDDPPHIHTRLLHCAWLASATLKDTPPNADRPGEYIAGIQWLLATARHSLDVKVLANSAWDLFVRLLDVWLGRGLKSTVVQCIKSLTMTHQGGSHHGGPTTLKNNGPPGIPWAAALGKLLLNRAPGMRGVVLPVCLHVLLTDELPPLVCWRLGYHQQELALWSPPPECALAVPVSQTSDRGALEQHVYATWVQAMHGRSSQLFPLQAFREASFIAAVPAHMLACLKQIQQPNALGEDVWGRVARQRPSTAAQWLVSHAQCVLPLGTSSAEQQQLLSAAAVGMVVAQEASRVGVSSTGHDAAHLAHVNAIAWHVAQLVIDVVQTSTLQQPLGGDLVPPSWPLCSLQYPWIPLPGLDGTALALGVWPLLAHLPRAQLVECMERCASLKPMPGCVPEMLLRGLQRCGLDQQTVAWGGALVAGAACVARPPSRTAVRNVAQLLQVDDMYSHAAEELLGMLAGQRGVGGEVGRREERRGGGW